MRPFFTTILCLVSGLLAAETRVGTCVSVAADGVATLRAADGTTFSRRLDAGDGKLGWSGRLVRFQDSVRDGVVFAQGLVSADPEELRRVAEVTDTLRRETVDKGRLVTRMPNELMPNFALFDQDGRLVMKKDFLGHALAINFIFTTCRVARMCPASTAAMKTLADRLAANAAARGIRLISITFDPETDTPGLLRSYADGYGIDPARHRFLTGDTGQIKDLMLQFGIQTVRDDGTIVHNAALVVMSPEGRIVFRSEGPIFDTEEVARRLTLLEAATGKNSR